MTKNKAQKLNYCKYCAACLAGRQMCGIGLDVEDKHLCRLDEKIIERWRKEFGLEKQSIPLILTNKNKGGTEND